MRLLLRRAPTVGAPNPLGTGVKRAYARYTVVAGGPGSGCKGPNCGKPGQVYKLPKGIPWHKAVEMPLHHSWQEHANWHRQSYGGVLVDSRGRFLLREPVNHFDGYHWTWPKGTVGDAKEHPAETAFREVAEETGRKGSFIGQLPGTYKSGSGGHNNFYIMRSLGNRPEYMDDETSRTRWATYDEAKRLISKSTNELGKQRDLAILDRARQHLQKYEVAGAAIQAGGPGSGCHGPNCGRPKTAHAVMSNLGWKKIGPTVKILNKAKNLHGQVLYKHPKYGTVTVTHHFTGPPSFEHLSKDTGAVAHAGKVGPFAKNIAQYMQNLHQAPAPVTPNGLAQKIVEQAKQAVGTSHPSGMHESYTNKYTGEVQEWSSKHQAYMNDANATPAKSPLSSNFPTSAYAMQKLIEKGEYEPTGQHTDFIKPPGMPDAFFHPATNDKFEFNPKNGMYETKTGALSVHEADKVLSQPVIKSAPVIPPTPKVDKATGPQPSPSKSTTTVPPSLNVTSDQFTFKGDGKALGGAHDKYVYTDKAGNDWLFKPATTLTGEKSPLMGHADEMVSRISQALRPGYAIEAKAITMNVPGKGEQFGSIQKMIPAQFLRGEGGKFKDFVGRDLSASPLQPWESKSLQQEQVLDWLISNHDSHGGQFLRTTGQYVGSRSAIGIDKSQAFRYFPDDKLSATYQPNTDTYGEKPPIYNEMWKQAQAGKLTLDPEHALETIKQAEGISRDDYKDMLKPYVEARFSSPVDQKAFYDAAIARKENLRSDFEKFYGEMLGKQNFKFEPVYDPNEKAVVNVATGKKEEFLPDTEVRPNAKASIQAALPALLDKYKEDVAKTELSKSIADKWQKMYWQQPPTMGDQARYEKAAKGLGVYPELAAKVGLMPADLTKVTTAISHWSSSTGHEGAAWIRAAAQDLVNNPDKPELKSRFSAALQIEHEVTKAKLAQMYPSGSMPLYRGLSDPVASKLKEAKKSAGIIQYHTMGAEGWTDNKTTATAFSGGVVLHVPNTPIDNVITSYKTSPAPHYHLHEAETFVAFPGKVQYLKASNIIVKGSVMKKKKGIIVIDGTEGQTHTANPTPGKYGPPVEVITMQAVDKQGKPLGKGGSK